MTWRNTQEVADEVWQMYSDELNRIQRLARRQKTRPLRRARVKDPLT